MKYLPIIFCLFFSSNAYSHGGGSNKQGCHNNRSTGDYHCHRGSKSQNKPSNSAIIPVGNEDTFNIRLANHLGGKTEVTYNYDYNINDIGDTYNDDIFAKQSNNSDKQDKIKSIKKSSKINKRSEISQINEDIDNKLKK